MAFYTILLIALALAVDAFAVALAAGVCLPQVTLRHTFRLSWHFGLFQAMMNVIGWAGGLGFRSLIEKFDHWLAFILLLFVGLKMIIEALKDTGQEEKCDPSRGKTLVLLSIATSIDSLAVGLSFAVLNVEILLPALFIGIVASLLTIAGLYIGKMAGAATQIGTRAEIAGGVVLIGIGLRILHEHGVF